MHESILAVPLSSEKCTPINPKRGFNTAINNVIPTTALYLKSYLSLNDQKLTAGEKKSSKKIARVINVDNSVNVSMGFRNNRYIHNIIVVSNAVNPCIDEVYSFLCLGYLDIPLLNTA